MSSKVNIYVIYGAISLVIGLYLGRLYSTEFIDAKIPNDNSALEKYSENGYLEVPLLERQLITHDTYIFTYKLPDSNDNLGVKTGQHIIIHAIIPTRNNPEGEAIARKYTPISNINKTGTFDLLVKIYRPGVHRNFPDGGAMGPYLESLKLGDKIKISGPVGRFEYLGDGKIVMQNNDRNQKLHVKKLGLIAGGSGITPMYQLIKALLNNPSDPTEIILLFGNRSEDDILLNEELKEASKDHRITVHHTIDTSRSDWEGYIGYITKDMLAKTMPSPSDDVLICHCGPHQMNQMLVGHLTELGYNEDIIFKF